MSLTCGQKYHPHKLVGTIVKDMVFIHCKECGILKYSILEEEFNELYLYNKYDIKKYDHNLINSEKWVLPTCPDFLHYIFN